MRIGIPDPVLDVQVFDGLFAAAVYQLAPSLSTGGRVPIATGRSAADRLSSDRIEQQIGGSFGTSFRELNQAPSPIARYPRETEDELKRVHHFATLTRKSIKVSASKPVNENN